MPDLMPKPQVRHQVSTLSRSNIHKFISNSLVAIMKYSSKLHKCYNTFFIREISIVLSVSINSTTG